jgi:signal transduction histidine kinase
MERPERFAPRVPVRLRVVLTLVALSAAALLIAGITAAALQRTQVTRSIDADLNASAAEFEVLAAEGINPETGARFTTAEDLLRVAMARVVPQANEGLVGFVDGSLAFRSSHAELALDADEELIAMLEPLTQLPEATLADISTSTTDYRVAVLPVTVTGTGGTSTTAAQVLAYDTRAELSGFERVFRIYGWVAVASVTIVAALAWLIAGRVLRPVRSLADTAGRVGQDATSERIPVTGRDELTDMQIAVNGMLDRLEASSQAQRALLDDVSHELRTPVTVIRGHLEVMGPEDLEETRAIALDELDRMSRLLDDLLTLAVSEQENFVVLGPVEVGVLLDEVFDKARALGDRDWQLGQRADAVVEADAQRLTQAWLQLASNAHKFSAEGSRITLSARVEGENLILSCADEGRGIPSEDQASIFDRFSRTGSTRRDGAGLGLAIVTEIVHAHGGTVSVDSAVGVGSVFSMTIPIPVDHQEGP